MVANEYQVGGTHYKSEYAHWDWVVNCQLNYLEGQATKYLARWDKKGDPENDLKKAKHYVEKLIEKKWEVPRSTRAINWVYDETRAFCDANKLTGPTQEAVFIIATWGIPKQLDNAVGIINGLLQELTVEKAVAEFDADDEWRREPTSQDKPVPAEDSNKHAERVDKDRFIVVGARNHQPRVLGRFRTLAEATTQWGYAVKQGWHDVRVYGGIDAR